jgi:hypothetical protein
MAKYLVTLKLESDTDPREWYLPDTLVIEEAYELYEVINIDGDK